MRGKNRIYKNEVSHPNKGKRRLLNSFKDKIENGKKIAKKAISSALIAAVIGTGALTYSCKRETAIKDSKVSYIQSSPVNELNNALIDAVREGDIERVRDLLDKGADVNARYENDHTVLMKAVGKGHVRIVQLLLNVGADVNARDMHGHTALMIASWKDHINYINIVKLLLEKGADVNVKDRYGNTTIIFAVRYSHPEIVKLLLDKGADPNIRDNNGMAPLMWAVIYGNVEMVQLLLNAGARPDIKDNLGRTPLRIVEDKLGIMDFNMPPATDEDMWKYMRYKYLMERRSEHPLSSSALKAYNEIYNLLLEANNSTNNKFHTAQRVPTPKNTNINEKQ